MEESSLVDLEATSLSDKTVELLKEKKLGSSLLVIRGAVQVMEDCKECCETEKLPKTSHETFPPTNSRP